MKRVVSATAGGAGRRVRFTGRLYRIGQLRCVDVPDAVARVLGGAGRIPVVVTIRRASGQSSLVPKRDGGHRLFIGAALRRAGLVESGDRARIEVRRDARGGEPDLPAELVESLAGIRGGLAMLRSRSPADRRQLVRWIEAPKSREARLHRVSRAVAMILRGKRRRRFPRPEVRGRSPDRGRGPARSRRAR